MSEALKTITLASLVKQGEVTSISLLKYNKSGYPYITLLKGNKPNNVYFSLKTAEVINNHFKEKDNVISILKNANICQTTNEEGEVRFKLSTSETSNYVSQAELMSAFGVEESVTDFDLELFRNQFTSQTAVVPAESTEA
jgi:hypothetical protein